MLNILLGMSTGGLLGMASKERHRHHDHADGPTTWEPYRIQIGGTLVVSAVTLLATLLALLVFVPQNSWIFSRRLGTVLVALWCVGTGVNLVIEMTGVWGDVATGSVRW